MISRVTSSVSYGTTGSARIVTERQISQRHLSGHAFRRTAGGEPGECVARAERRSARQQRPQILEAVTRSTERV